MNDRSNELSGDNESGSRTGSEGSTPNRIRDNGGGDNESGSRTGSEGSTPNRIRDNGGGNNDDRDDAASGRSQRGDESSPVTAPSSRRRNSGNANRGGRGDSRDNENSSEDARRESAGKDKDASGGDGRSDGKTERTSKGKNPQKQKQEEKDEKKDKGGINKTALAITLSLLSVLLIAAAGYYCVRRRQRQRNYAYPPGETSPGLPAFAGPLRRIVVDSRSKGSGPGLTTPLEAYYNPMNDQQLLFASSGQDLDVIQARKPKQVARGYRDQRTGQPVKSVIDGWDPEEDSV